MNDCNLTYRGLNKTVHQNVDYKSYYTNVLHPDSSSEQNRLSGKRFFLP